VYLFLTLSLKESGMQDKLVASPPESAFEGAKAESWLAYSSAVLDYTI
jgi:hypothetical protein